ncbi:MAG: DNA adenine methylase [Ruminococcus sp.]|nr:DNA adenine methylase [Ruminococcus sp.]
MNSFIAWIGGKKLLRKAIMERFPEDGFDRYIEVFGGAGWVLFGKDAGKELEVFNDADSNLINLYRCIKYHREELQRELEWTLVSREQFFDHKSQLESDGLTDIQRAARYFHIIKVSFGSDRRTFGTNKKNLANSIAYLGDVQERLKNVVIENKDFESLIKVYDRPKALFYLDPPYHGTEKYYDAGFTLEDHLRLKTVLEGVKGKFILSYNDDEFIRDLYKDFHIEGISRNSNLTNKNTADNFEEVIIRNY